ncbi:MAG: hypothetical protein MJ137_07200 [Clostridia bacterium]|nr:hypothetical protein [Clostridia bacterium]
MNKKRILLIKRLAMSLVGLILISLSVAILKISAFGLDPFQTMMAGIDLTVQLSYGTLNVMVNAVLLIFGLIFNRKLVGIGTILNLAFLGYAVDFFMWLIKLLFPAPSLITRILLFSFDMVLLNIACSLYMTADMGVSTYDAIAITMAEKWHIMKFRNMRIVTDIVCVTLGCILYFISGVKPSGIFGIAGVGTILTAFCMGPCIDFFNRTLSKPLLYGRKNR